LVRRGELPKQLVAVAGGDERQAADYGRWMAGGAHKPRVLIVRHLETSDEKFADEDTMNRTLIVVGVYSAHQEVARRNAYEVGRWNGISHRARRPFLDRDHKNRSIVRTIITFMEIADVKRRVIETIDRARRRAGDRRT